MALSHRLGSLTASICRFGNSSRAILLNSQIEECICNSKRFYAVRRTVAAATSKMKGVGSVTSSVPKYKLQPVQDAELLTKRLCGGNFMKEGEDPVLKPDSEYPDWLWNLRIDRSAVPLEELEPDTWAYWGRILTLDRRRRNDDLALKYKQHRFSTPPPFKKVVK